MRKIVFDSSTLISLSDKCLMNVMGRMARAEGVEFIVSQSVLDETVLYPIKIRKFELNAVRISNAIDRKWLSIVQSSATTKRNVEKIESIAENLCMADNRPMKIVHRGEIETLAVAKEIGADAIAMDERTTRMLMEEPSALKDVLQNRLQKKIRLNSQAAREFREFVGDIPVVRSVELIALSYERNYFGEELPHNKTALEAALFAAKYSGCAVSGEEIKHYLKAVK
jgi:hypothetical protein